MYTDGETHQRSPQFSSLQQKVQYIVFVFTGKKITGFTVGREEDDSKFAEGPLLGAVCG